MATINVIATQPAAVTAPEGYIPLVRNDLGPQIRLTLTDSIDKTPFDLVGGTVTVHVRREGRANVLFSRDCFFSGDIEASAGIAYLLFTEGDLDLPAGRYEAEVEMFLSDGFHQTVYDLLKFYVREEIA